MIGRCCVEHSASFVVYSVIMFVVFSIWCLMPTSVRPSASSFPLSQKALICSTLASNSCWASRSFLSLSVFICCPFLVEEKGPPRPA
jgi:hypothetical protein